MSNDTREALAAKCKTLAESYADGPHDGGYYGARRTALYAAIDELAALTEQPAAPELSPEEQLALSRGAIDLAASKDRLLAAPQGVQAEPLPGFVLVPKEPTLGMMRAGLEGLGSCVGSCGEASPPELSDVADAYEAMLAAAPAAPAQEPQQPAPSDDADRMLLREVFAVCEATEDECGDSPDNFARGRAFEAKRIRRGIGTWYQDTFCGRSFMGEPALAVPPTSEAVTELVKALEGLLAAATELELAGRHFAVDYARAMGAKHGQPQGAPAVQPLTMGRIYEAWHEIGADVAGLSWAKFAEALQHGQPAQGGGA